MRPTIIKRYSGQIQLPNADNRDSTNKIAGGTGFSNPQNGFYNILINMARSGSSVVTTNNIVENLKSHTISPEDKTSCTQTEDNANLESTQSQPTGYPVPTSTLYDLWATTYDTDNNILQAVDDIYMQDLVPAFAEKVLSTPRADTSSATTLLDLGCGTGRNTCKLQQYQWSRPVAIEGWDASEAMLKIAWEKYRTVVNDGLSGRKKMAEFRCVDFAGVEMLDKADKGRFNGIISTLVLEHLPLSKFFETLAWLLHDNGYALISNMHSDMGARTQAGFKDEGGRRMMGTSYVHDVEETVAAARKAGLEIVGEVKEKEVDKKMVQNGTVSERGIKWIGVRVWYGVLLRKK